MFNNGFDIIEYIWLHIYRETVRDKIMGFIIENQNVFVVLFLYAPTPFWLFPCEQQYYMRGKQSGLPMV